MRASVTVAQDKREQIVCAALTQAAAHGVSRMTLRGVAATCGVSLGLVQHYFGSKAALISAVDEYVLERFADTLDLGSTDMRDGLPHHFTHLLARRPDIMDYVARALCDGEPIGAVIFDRLVAAGAGHTPAHTETGGTDGPDPVWATLNPLILTLGTIMFRGHVERHLSNRLYGPEQLTRWDDALKSLMRDGYIRHGIGSS